MHAIPQQLPSKHVHLEFKHKEKPPFNQGNEDFVADLVHFEGNRHVFSILCPELGTSFNTWCGLSRLAE